MSNAIRTTFALAACILLSPAQAGEPVTREKQSPATTPLVRTADLDVGQSQEVELADGSRTRLKLLDLQETRDKLRNAVRASRVKVEVNGQTVTLSSAMYQLPVTVAGVQIDCPITRGLTDNSSKQNVWGLTKDARFRLWPAGSPWIEPGTFTYPVRQRWFASDTQMANEPTFVNGDELPGKTSIYYHYGLDFGGAEGLVEVIAATDGVVVSAAGEILPEHKESPAKPRYDVIYVLDQRGWYYRYSHLMTVEVKLGQRVRMGQRIGLLGKEGGSGGWSHLHFDVTSRQPSGQWGIQDAYAYAWQAYRREYAPSIIAVARPHHLASVGDRVLLDGSRSWSDAGKIARYEWTFTDSSRATGPQVERTYSRPGTYSEVLQITDAEGRTGWDFCVVQVVDPVRRGSPDPAETNDRKVSGTSGRASVGDVARSGDRPQPVPKELPPTIHAAYYPTTNLRPGDPITFKVRTFRTTHGEERWDFGDGTPPVTVQSDGNANVHAKDGYAVTQHAYAKPGDYLVRVERANERGETAVGHLHVKVETPFQARTSVSIQNGKWHINGQVTCPGTRAEGLLMNVRMVNSVFEDRRKPDFDAQANTDRFLERIPDYAAHGVRAFTICLQGGMPGYEGALNSAFDPDGCLRESYLDRVRRGSPRCGNTPSRSSATKTTRPAGSRPRPPNCVWPAALRGA